MKAKMLWVLDSEEMPKDVHMAFSRHTKPTYGTYVLVTRPDSGSSLDHLLVWDWIKNEKLPFVLEEVLIYAHW